MFKVIRIEDGAELSIEDGPRGDSEADQLVDVEGSWSPHPWMQSTPDFIDLDSYAMARNASEVTRDSRAAAPGVDDIPVSILLTQHGERTPTVPFKNNDLSNPVTATERDGNAAAATTGTVGAPRCTGQALEPDGAGRQSHARFTDRQGEKRAGVSPHQASSDGIQSSQSCAKRRRVAAAAVGADDKMKVARVLPSNATEMLPSATSYVVRVDTPLSWQSVAEKPGLVEIVVDKPVDGRLYDDTAAPVSLTAGAEGSEWGELPVVTSVNGSLPTRDEEEEEEEEEERGNRTSFTVLRGVAAAGAASRHASSSRHDASSPTPKSGQPRPTGNETNKVNRNAAVFGSGATASARHQMAPAAIFATDKNAVVEHVSSHNREANAAESSSPWQEDAYPMLQQLVMVEAGSSDEEEEEEKEGRDPTSCHVMLRDVTVSRPWLDATRIKTENDPDWPSAAEVARSRYGGAPCARKQIRASKTGERSAKRDGGAAYAGKQIRASKTGERPAERDGGAAYARKRIRVRKTGERPAERDGGAAYARKRIHARKTGERPAERDSGAAAAAPREGKFFDCDECSSSFTHGGILKRHQEVLHAPRATMPHMCERCACTFANFTRLARHQGAHRRHDEMPLVRPARRRADCPECGRVLESRLMLAWHRCDAHGVLNNRFVCCCFCATPFWGEESLAAHVKREHAGRRFEIGKCCQCAMKMATATHVPAAQLFCGRCSRGDSAPTREGGSNAASKCDGIAENEEGTWWVDWKTKLEVETSPFDRKRKPEEPQLSSCAKCGQAFATASSLDEHARTCRAATCPCCDRVFSTAWYTRMHLASVHNVRDGYGALAQDVGATATQNAGTDRKTERSTEDRKTEGPIDRKTEKNHHSSAAATSKTGESSARWAEGLVTQPAEGAMACPRCGGMFSKRSSLRRHLRLRRCKGPGRALVAATCPRCRRVFASSGSMHKHMTSNCPSAGAAAVRCSHCRKPILAFNMDRHMRTKHPAVARKIRSVAAPTPLATTSAKSVAVARTPAKPIAVATTPAKPVAAAATPTKPVAAATTPAKPASAATCPHCQRVFSSAKYARRHALTSCPRTEGARAIKYCPECHHAVLATNMNRHIRYKHPALCEFACSKCGKCYRTHLLCRRHELRIHGHARKRKVSRPPAPTPAAAPARTAAATPAVDGAAKASFACGACGKRYRTHVLRCRHERRIHGHAMSKIRRGAGATAAERSRPLPGVARDITEQTASRPRDEKAGTREVGERRPVAEQEEEEEKEEEEEEENGNAWWRAREKLDDRFPRLCLRRVDETMAAASSSRSSSSLQASPSSGASPKAASSSGQTSSASSLLQSSFHRPSPSSTSSQRPSLAARPERRAVGETERLREELTGANAALAAALKKIRCQRRALLRAEFEIMRLKKAAMAASNPAPSGVGNVSDDVGAVMRRLLNRVERGGDVPAAPSTPAACAETSDSAPPGGRESDDGRDERAETLRELDGDDAAPPVPVLGIEVADLAPSGGREVGDGIRADAVVRDAALVVNLLVSLVERGVESLSDADLRATEAEHLSSADGGCDVGTDRVRKRRRGDDTPADVEF
ncbi:PREDICTED: uncharacterized protein LOC106812013 [Priapulus caudatus]|uniref:Uncharacterized protein LOC106812013 n=1 Tax=Priapulus caudatus TaxID=37621 RepID=A0ABM1EGD0_PRICU|nr:PREDICTED: uncharacterized protein LOC106812013 [Priapulus caudatus]